MPYSSSSSSSSSDWKETALVAILAAGFGSMVTFQFLSYQRNYYKYRDEEDFLYQRRYYDRRRRDEIDSNNNNNNNNNHVDQNYHSPRRHSSSMEYFNNININNTKTEEEDFAEAAVSKGWSMAEAMAAAKKERKKIANMTPREVLQSLQRGNMRFYSGNAGRPEKSAFQRRALISQQFPTTAVLGCSDSRVPVEIVFDQGLGDMFAVRVAGNCLGTTTEASLLYAVLHLNVKVLMVMGHEGCGAIKAAGLPVEQINKEPPALATLLNQVKSGLKPSSDTISQLLDARARDREAVVVNVANQVMKLADDPQILERIEQGQLKIVGAFYEISSGIVDFFHLVAQDVPGEVFKPSPGVQSRYNPRTKRIVYA